MDDLKGKEERPWDVCAEKPEKVDEIDRTPLLRRNFEGDFISIERGNWYRCFSTPAPSACDIVISLILLVTMASTLVWILGTSHHANMMNAQAYQSDGETSSNGMTDCSFQRSWTVVMGRRGMHSSQTEAAQITAVQEALQKAQFSNNCCHHGRKLLLDNPPPNPETLESLYFSDSDTNADDYPNPGPNPSPPDHDYPPPALRSEMKPDVHIDYAPVGPHPSPDYHDYPPPALGSETKPDVHTDYAPARPHPSPDYHDYPPPASIV